MDKPKIIIPSKGRAEDCTTAELIPQACIVAPISEAKDYRLHNPQNEVVELPEGILGISATRQWILENYDEPFMIDDDVKGLRRMYEDTKDRMNIEDGSLIVEIINQCKHIAEQMGAKMYGFTNLVTPVNVRAFTPYRLTGFLCASGCGYLKGHGLKENPDIVSADDYWMSCLNVYQNRYMLISNRYSFIKNSNFKNSGGLQGIRTSENMKKDTYILKEHFGSVIKSKKPTSDKQSTIEGERTLEFPF